jgi:hypothetical protein
MSEKTPSPYDVVLWTSKNPVRMITIPSPGGSCMILQPNQSMKFVGIVYKANETTAVVYWLGYRAKLSNSNLYEISRSLFYDKAERHCMFGTTTKNPTYESFTSAGLKSLDVPINELVKMNMSDDKCSEQWWYKIVQANMKWYQKCTIL